MNQEYPSQKTVSREQFHPVTLENRGTNESITPVWVAYSIFFLLIMGYILLLSRRVKRRKKSIKMFDKHNHFGDHHES